MNSLEMKKRAFMAAVTRNYGFVRVKSGALPLTLESCIRANLINYKISGNVGTNLFNMNLITNSNYEIHPDENYIDVKAYSITAMSPSNFIVMSGLKAGDTVTTARTKEVIQEGEGSNGAWGRVTLLSKVSGVSSVVLCDVNENMGTVTIPDDFNPNNYYGLVIYGMNKTDAILRIHNLQIVKGSYTEETMPEYEPYKRVGDLDSASGKYKIPVTVSGKNLIPYPYTTAAGNVMPITQTLNGVTFTINDDRSITVNGTATNTVYYHILSLTGTSALNLPAAKYYFFDNCDSVSSPRRFSIQAKKWVDGSFQYVLTLSDGNGVFNLTGLDFNRIWCVLVISAGDTFDNVTFKPQLELGETATEYEPYKEPQTTNIFVSAPLKIGESIEYKTDNLPDIAVSDGTNIISVGTEVSPSAFEAEYYSNIKEE